MNTLTKLDPGIVAILWFFVITLLIGFIYFAKAVRDWINDEDYKKEYEQLANMVNEAAVTKHNFRCIKYRFLKISYYSCADDEKLCVLEGKFYKKFKEVSK